MNNSKGLKNRVGEIRDEILFAIKERVKEITSEDVEKPICLNDVSVIDPNNITSGVVNYLQLHSIFYDESGKLCGDFVGGNSGLCDGFIFGRSVEGLHIEDLVKIFNNLYNDNWKIIENQNKNFTKIAGNYANESIYI